LRLVRRSDRAARPTTRKRRPRTQHARCQVGHLRYWENSEFSVWSLAALRPWDLIEWRRRTLDEDNANDGEFVGPAASCGTQAVVHRLNTLSMLYKTWSLAKQVLLTNPVVPLVRPPLNNDRDRRLLYGEEPKLLQVVQSSSRPWLPDATVIAIETALRKSEFCFLTRRRIDILGQYPNVYLPKRRTISREPSPCHDVRSHHSDIG
jgi:integrase